MSGRSPRDSATQRCASGCSLRALARPRLLSQALRSPTQSSEKTMKARLVLAAMFLTASSVIAQNPQTAQPSDSARAATARNRGGGQCDRNAYNCVDAKNPLPAPTTVWMEEMTWMDVRDALAAGKTTVII